MGAYVMNLDEYKSLGTNWIVLYVNGDNVTYVDSFGVEYIPTEIKNIQRQEKHYNKCL